MTDKQIIRELAKKYYEYALSDENISKVKLHKSVNDRKMIRPAVFIDELPWHEMNCEDRLTMKCEDKSYHGLEWHFRSAIYRWECFRADMYLTPYFKVTKHINSTGIGLHIDEKIIRTDERNGIVSHEYHDMLKTEDDIDNLKFEKITYDETATRTQFNYIGDLIGDILPVKISGCPSDWLNCNTWDNISRYKGVDVLLEELIDRPEFMHKIMRKFTDIYIDKIKQYNDMNLLEDNSVYVHCTPAFTDELPKVTDPDKVALNNVWGRGTAQIFGAVSPAMHDEFEFKYAAEAMKDFGLVYYGCCEPLDNKLDLLKQIKNLRKISITPWANINAAAEIIGNDYVIAAKPNPANVGVTRFDEIAVRKEVEEIVNACRKNGTSCDIVIKDISTVKYNPQNIFKWEKLVMDIVKN